MSTATVLLPMVDHVLPLLGVVELPDALDARPKVLRLPVVLETAMLLDVMGVLVRIRSGGVVGGGGRRVGVGRRRVNCLTSV